MAQICLAAIAGCSQPSVRNSDDKKVQVVGSKPVFHHDVGPGSFRPHRTHTFRKEV
jgi:hypothetical protein